MNTKQTFWTPPKNNLRKIVNKVNKDLSLTRKVDPPRNFVDEEDIKRVISGDYLENHPVDKTILKYLKRFKKPFEEDTQVANPS